MKRAQIQLGETIFVVIIILLLIVFGIVFYAEAQGRENRQQQSFLEELDAIVISKYLTQLSELECSRLQVQQANCLDKYKLESLQKFAEAEPELFSQVYFTELQDAKLWVQDIYPTNQSTWVLYNNTLGNRTPRRTTLSIIPVSIYDPITQEQKFGVLQLETYYR